MNTILKKHLDNPEIKIPLLKLFYELGYLTNPSDENSLTEKALKKTPKVKYEMDGQLYERIKELWPKGQWTSSLAACNAQVTKLFKNFPDKKDTMVHWEKAAKYYLATTSYHGELKYFFYKDNDSRLLKALEELAKKPQQTFKER